MRSPDEQEDFLKYGRFGDGIQKVAKARVPVLVKIGLVFIGMGCATLATSAILSELARERGQWYLVGEAFDMGAALLASIGVGFCLLALVRRLVRRRTG